MNYDDMEDPEAGEGPVLDDVEDKPDNVSAGLDILRVLQNQLSSSEKSNHLAAWSQLQRPDALTAIADAWVADEGAVSSMLAVIELLPGQVTRAKALRSALKRLVVEKKKLAKAEKEIAGLAGRLANPNFAGKAPPEVVAECQANLAEAEAQAALVRGRLAELG